ncbi:MAG: DUF6800 family protein [Planctomycetia bacterium]|nr:DUF6800 family protein [Planctomycetia bacterium]
MSGISDRQQEIKRRRHRRKKYVVMARKLKKATVSEKTVLAEKLRNLTSGCNELIERWGLVEKR